MARQKVGKPQKPLIQLFYQKDEKDGKDLSK